MRVGERIKLAWEHKTSCQYVYSDSFSKLSPSDQILNISPHFGFIGKDEAIPELQQYLVIDDM